MNETTDPNAEAAAVAAPAITPVEPAAVKPEHHYFRDFTNWCERHPMTMLCSTFLLTTTITAVCMLCRRNKTVIQQVPMT